MATVLDQLQQSHALSDDVARVVADVQRSVVLVRGTRHSTGSGVVWDEAGTIITNHHVVPEPVAEVIFENGDRFAARVTRRSESLDLVALAPAEASSYPWPVASVGDSAELRAGELVLAVGNPMGERNVATLGMLVATPDASADVLRAAITLRPGNSGGALSDSEGRIVGIPHIVMPGGLAQAVSSRAVQRFLHEGEAKARPTLGIIGHWVRIPRATREQIVDARAGLLVSEVASDSLAEHGGVLLGDLLVGFTPAGSDGILDLRTWTDGNVKAGKIATIRAGKLRWVDLDSIG